MRNKNAGETSLQLVFAKPSWSVSALVVYLCFQADKLSTLFVVNVSLWTLLLSRLPKFPFQTELAFLRRMSPRAIGTKSWRSAVGLQAPPCVRVCYSVSAFCVVVRICFSLSMFEHRGAEEAKCLSVWLGASRKTALNLWMQLNNNLAFKFGATVNRLGCTD